MQTAFSKEFDAKKLKLNYLVSTPDGFDKEKESLPMIVFLHGAGERGDNVNDIKCHGIPKLFATGHSPTCPDLRVITLSPQCPWDCVWNTLVHQVAQLIDEVAEEYNVDKTKISVTGLSMGGFGSYELATAYPFKFSALAMCCGGGMEWRANMISHMPIRLYHGLDDDLVLPERTVTLANAMKAYGANPDVYLIEGVDHGVWNIAYDKTDLISWLASQVNERMNG